MAIVEKEKDLQVFLKKKKKKKKKSRTKLYQLDTMFQKFDDIFHFNI